MVATKLSELAGKGWGWYSGPTLSNMDGEFSSDVAPGDTTNTGVTSSLPPSTPKRPGCSSPSSPGSETTPSSSTPSRLLEYAQDTAESTYSAVSSYLPSFSGWNTGGNYLSDTNSDNSPMDPMIENNVSRQRNNNSNSLLTSPAVLNLFHNPYVAVRGGGNHQAHRPSSSMEAIRSLINAVPALDNAAFSDNADFKSDGSPSMMIQPTHDGSSFEGAGTHSSPHGMPGNGAASERYFQPSSVARQSSASETASQIAEGTLRAFRDIALDEAVELHQALRYWSYRWERPLLSWLEAGPTVWFSEDGYQHQLVGQKVSQIQAVLARRCATIGDLQSHLLRSGWQRGVAQWAVLGEGGEWATVAGGDGRMINESGTPTTPPPMVTPPPPPPPGYSFRRISTEMIDQIPPPGRPALPRKAPASNVSQLPQATSRHNQLYYTNVLVKNNDGGRIVIDDPALAEWSVDAIALVRRQLFRAANGHILLPYTENWAEGDDQSRLSYDVAGAMVLDGDTAATDESVAGVKLPLWASLRTVSDKEDGEDEDEDTGRAQPQNHEDGNGDAGMEPSTRIRISDLPLLVNEVSELLDTMNSVMQIQRARRLDKLKPQKWWRRNWYVGALGIPPLFYLTYKAAHDGFGLFFLRYTAKQFAHFFQEHVIDPIFAMYEEFTKGTVDISDREARNVTIKNLRKMIRSWLDETYPEMPIKERKRMAKNMDISLIEAEKEESMKRIYNFNSVIRMSFIEAQFLKKEMMNALLAIDEMRAATNFNMNVAAVTPFVLLVWATQRTFKFVYYAMLRMGKTREETYGSFVHTLTDLERLLVMRDNPPAPSGHRPVVHDGASHSSFGESILNPDDLGMLMLHIHELRTVLWEDRRRFSNNVVRSVAEDLAELAGERGAVSVRQQLQIISRMCRTYPFLRAVNDRMFEYR